MNKKENNWKLITSLALLLIAIAVGYYFFYFIPKTKQAEILSKNQSDCSELGDKSLSDYKTSEKEMGTQISGMESQTNHYNQKLNKCIVEITNSSVSDQQLTDSLDILDAKENRELAWCSVDITNKNATTCFDFSNDLNGEAISKTVFDALEKQYMTQ